MKIHNKMGFAQGMVFLVLGIIYLIDLIIDKDIKSLLVGGFAIFSGIRDIAKSLSGDLTNEDDIGQRNDRNRWIQLKSSEKSLLLLELIISIVFFVLIVYYVYTRQRFIIPYILIFVGLLALIETLKSALWNYCVKRPL